MGLISAIFGKKAPKDAPNAKSKPKKLKGLARTCQDLMDFDYITEDGIIVTNNGYSFSKLYMLPDSNFVTETEEKQIDLIEKYGKLLAHFDENVMISVVIVNKLNTREQMVRSYHLKDRGDDLNAYRKDYNSIIDAKIKEARNDVSKEKYFLITVNEKTLEAAELKYQTIDMNLNDMAKEINRAGVKKMNAFNRLELMRDIMNGPADVPFEQAFSKYFTTSRDNATGEDVTLLDVKAMKRDGISVKDLIAPQTVMKHREELILNDTRHCKSFGYINLPPSLDTSFLTNTTNIPYEMVTVIQLKACPKNDAQKLIKAQAVSIKADVIKASQQAYAAGYSPELMNEDLKLAMQESQELRDDVMNQGKKLFYGTMVVTIFAQDETALNAAVNDFKGKCSDHSLIPNYLIGQQHQAMNTALLIGNSKIIQDRMITSDNATAMFPFNIQELQDKRGHFYGINAVSNNMIMYDRKRSKLANGLVFGISGSGKSFFTKGEIIPNLLDSEDDIIILDPENEYRIVAREFGGTVIDLEPNSDFHINPCDMSMEWDDPKQNPLVEKSDYMVSLVEAVLGKNRECNPFEVNCIHRCCRRMYESYMEQMKERYENGDTRSIDTEICPTLADFYGELIRDETAESNKLASAMEQYCIGSYDLFSHRTNIETKSRLTVFNLLKLPSKMTEMAMKVCLSYIWTQIVHNREENDKYHTGKSIWVYLDEFHHFFKTETSATTIMAYFKRVRKYGGIMTGITQDVADLLQSNQGRAMFNNTGFFAVLNQSPIGRQQLQSLWGVPSTLIDFIKDRPSGMGIIYNNTTLIPFNYKLPQTSELYRIMSTNPHDEVAAKPKLEKEEQTG